MTPSPPIPADGPRPESAGLSLGAALAGVLVTALALGGLWLAKLQVELWNQPTIDQLQLELKPGPGAASVVLVRNASAGTMHALGLDRSLLFFGVELKEGGEWKRQAILRGCIVSEVPIKPGEVLTVSCPDFDNPRGRPLRVTLEVTAKIRKTLLGEAEMASLGTARSNAL